MYVCAGVHCGERVEFDNVLCKACWDYRRWILERVPLAWAVAHRRLLPAQRVAARVSGGAGPTSKAPMDMGVYSALEATLSCLETWASIARERLELDPLPRRDQVRTGYLLHLSLVTLLHHDGVLGGQWFASSYYNAIYKTHRNLAIAAGLLTAEIERLMVGCPACSSMSVVSRDYGDHVVCLTCGGAWGQAAFHAIDNAKRIPITSPVVDPSR